MFLRWIVVGMVAVGLVTVAALASGPDVASDLRSRAIESLEPDALHWADLKIDGRDAILLGTATDEADIASALERVTAVRGIRAVANEASLAPLASPYPFSATVAGGVVTIAGATPDRTLVAEIAAEAGAGSGELTLMSGAPDRTAWRETITYALKYLAEFDTGQVEMSDLALTISGRAKSRTAFDYLTVLSRVPPANVDILSSSIEPPLETPYKWRAEFDGGAISIAGFAPDETAIAAMKAAAGEIPVSASLLLASGEPDGFADYAVRLIANLAKLERGTASIDGSERRLSGAPPTKEVAQAVVEDLNSGDSIVTLQPPRVPEYWLSATLADGRIVLDGYVPTEETQQRLADTGADATGLELARGAPDRFDSAVDFGLSALGQMSEGSVAIRDDTMTIRGRAARSAAFDALTALVAEGAPQGTVLTSVEIRPPVADPFLWSAERLESGQILVSGSVPSAAIRASLAASAIEVASDTSSIADGGPADFETAATTGLRVLTAFDTGKLAYDGSGWSLTGTVDTEAKARFAATRADLPALVTAGWTYSLTVPPPPLVEPYAFKAEKSPAGTLALSGALPNPGMQRYLAVRGGRVVDSTALGSGEPEGFASNILAGLDALLQFDEGVLQLKDGVWSLSGRTKDADLPARAQAALAAAVDTEAWQFAFVAPKPLPPPADPYVWSAVKGGDGRYTLAGYVLNEGLKRYIAIHVRAVASDTTAIASGAPEGFVTDLLAGLDALEHLQSGTVAFDGIDWSLSGTPQTAADAMAAFDALAAGTSTADGWKTEMAEPLTAPEPEPLAEPEPMLATEPAPVAAAEAEPLALPEPLAVPEAIAEAVPVPQSAPAAAVEPEAAGAPVVEPGPATGVAPEGGTAATVAPETAAAVPAGPETAAVVPPEPDEAALQSESAVAAAVAPDAGTAAPVPESAAAVALVPEGAATAEPQTESAAAVAPAGEAAAAPDPVAVAAVEPESLPLVDEVATAAIPEPETINLPAADPDTAALASAGSEALVTADLPADGPVSVGVELDVPAALLFDVRRIKGGQVELSGVVPAEATAKYFGVIAGKVPTDRLAVADNLPADFIPNATEGIRALTELSEGRLAFDGRRWSLHGVARTDVERQAALGAVSGLPSWSTEIALTPPLDLCREEVAGFSARTSILFRSGSAEMTEDSAAALDELANYLAVCPEAEVHVEGHTDADGADDLNLALSVARAESVVSELIADGVGEDRLYAVGYGESVPIASNDTTAGKQANRRIVFTILEPGEE